MNMQAGSEAELYEQEDVHCVLRQASRQKTVHSVQCAGRPWGIEGRQKFFMASMQEGVRTRQAGGCAFLNLHVDEELLV
jgi:hypothetical protein